MAIFQSFNLKIFIFQERTMSRSKERNIFELVLRLSYYRITKKHESLKHSAKCMRKKTELVEPDFTEEIRLNF